MNVTTRVKSHANAARTIANIAENTVPLSLDPVPSLEPVVLVLEIAGGRSAELGIKAGDTVEWAP